MPSPPRGQPEAHRAGAAALSPNMAPSPSGAAEPGRGSRRGWSRAGGAGRPRGRRPAPALFPALWWVLLLFLWDRRFLKTQKTISGRTGRGGGGAALLCRVSESVAPTPCEGGAPGLGRALGVGWGPARGGIVLVCLPQGEAYFDIQPVCV